MSADSIPRRYSARKKSARFIKTSENREPPVLETIAMVLSLILAILTFPFSLFFCIRIVNAYENGVLFRVGRLRRGGPRRAGVVFILPCIDNLVILDMRTKTFDVEPQEILTRDSVTIKIDAVVYYRIQDPLNAVIQVVDYRLATKLLSQTTLRNVAGTKQLTELLAQKDEISRLMQKILDSAADVWGIKIERVEIKDVRLPQSLQRAMAAEAEATREAKAKIIAAEGEKNAAESLRDASDIITESPTALQLRYLQTLNTIAAEKHAKILFPFPIDIPTLSSLDICECRKASSNQSN